MAYRFLTVGVIQYIDFVCSVLFICTWLEQVAKDVFTQYGHFMSAFIFLMCVSVLVVRIVIMPSFGVTLFCLYLLDAVLLVNRASFIEKRGGTPLF